MVARDGRKRTGRRAATATAEEDGEGEKKGVGRTPPLRHVLRGLVGRLEQLRRLVAGGWRLAAAAHLVEQRWWQMGIAVNEPELPSPGTPPKRSPAVAGDALSRLGLPYIFLFESFFFARPRACR